MAFTQTEHQQTNQTGHLKHRDQEQNVVYGSVPCSKGEEYATIGHLVPKPERQKTAGNKTKGQLRETRLGSIH